MLVLFTTVKVSKKAKIINRYTYVPHPTQDSIWESDKNTRKYHTQESQEANTFQAGDHECTKNRQDSITKTNMNYKLQKSIHRRSTILEQSVSKLRQGLNMFNGTNLTLISDVDQDTRMFGLRESSLTYRCNFPEHTQTRTKEETKQSQGPNSTAMPAKSNIDAMFCLQSYQGLIIDRSLVYKSYPQDRTNSQVIYRFTLAQV